MIEYQEAIELIIKNSKMMKVKEVHLFEAVGKVLAEDLIAKEDSPYFDMSAVDGFALNYEDTIDASNSNPVELKVIGEVYAGESNYFKIKRGKAIKISTGSEIPEGANSVIKKEEVEEINGKIKIFKTLKKFENVRIKGSEFKKGELLMKKGTYLTPASIGLIAKAGYSRIKVVEKPFIGVISCGDELLDPGEELFKGKIWDATSYAICSALEYENLNFRFYGRVKDEFDAIKDVFTKSLSENDVTIIIGSSGEGEKDLARKVIEDKGVERIFYKVNVSPCKSLYFGKHENKLIFIMPGNASSALIGYYIFLRTSLERISGKINPFLPKVEAKLDERIDRRKAKKEFLKGKAYLIGNEFHAKPTKEQDPHYLIGFVNSNCIIELDEDKEIYEEGRSVKVHLLPWFNLDLSS